MKQLLKQFAGRDAHPVVQFIKYGIAGVIATSVDVGLFYFLSLTVFPALQPDDDLLVGLVRIYDLAGDHLFRLPADGWLYHLFHLQVDAIPQSLRERNFIINRCVVFLASNFTAYLLNMLWVFKPGRHSRRKEVTLFYLVSISSFIIGTVLGWGLISLFAVSTSHAYLANLVCAVLINYVCRKYIVFHG